MAITLVDDAATIGATEYYLASDSTTKTSQTEDCMLQVTIDVSVLDTGDSYEWKLYEKINTVEQVFASGVVSGAQPHPIVIPALTVGNGWEVSMKKLTGTDRSIGWTLRKVT
jgi:hypothetical protein